MKLTAALATLAISLGAFSQVTYDRLENRRPNLKFNELTSEEKLLIVDQARLILKDVFAHRTLKLQNFGATSDPLPKLDQLDRDSKDLSAELFHARMSKIFDELRDLHTSYQFPAPYMCYRTILPVYFKEAINLEGKKGVYVRSVLDREDIRKHLYAPSIGVSTGDELLSYNGKPMAQKLTELDQNGGANPTAARRVSIGNLSMVSQKFAVIPAENDVTLELRKPNGETYSVTIPWITSEDASCLNSNKAATAKGEVGTHERQQELNELFRQTKKVKSTGRLLVNGFYETAEPVLTYKTIKNEQGSFGIFKLDSFSPSKLSVIEVAQEFRRIAETDFAKTDGLIIDVRDNGGGYIWLGEILVQLFRNGPTTPHLFRLRATAPNVHYLKFTNSMSPFYQSILNSVLQNQAFSTDIAINTTENLNALGQAYFKPVAVFNNGNCYSSCDLFSAQMKDHGAAFLVGEDETTGAGGANNNQLKDFVSSLEKNPMYFKALPQKMNIGFSWRQMVRVGANAGQLIEDTGVRADFVIPTSLKDLSTVSSEQYAWITTKLKEQSHRYRHSVDLKTHKRVDLVLNTQGSLRMGWTETSTIQFKVGAATVKTEEVEFNNPDGRDFPFPQDYLTKLQIGKMEIVGLHGIQQVWKKILDYRVIPESQVLSADGLEMNFADPATPKPYLYSNRSGGWKIQDGVLKVGAPKYAANVNTEASLFVVLPTEPMKLQFSSVGKTEKDYDYLYVKAVVDGTEVDLIPRVSGDLAQKTEEVDLSRYAGKKIEIRFNFVSDGAVEETGPEIQSIKILRK